MTKADEREKPDSCFNRALDHELMFILLERDHAAPVAIRAWAAERIRIGANKPGDAKILEALAVADSMKA